MEVTNICNEMNEIIIKEEINSATENAQNESTNLIVDVLPLYTELYPEKQLLPRRNVETTENKDKFKWCKFLWKLTVYCYNIIFVCISISSLYVGIFNINTICNNKLATYLILLGVSCCLYKMINILFYCNCFGRHGSIGASAQVVIALIAILMAIFIISNREIKDDCSTTDPQVAYIYSQQLAMIVFFLYTAELCYHGSTNFKNLL